MPLARHALYAEGVEVQVALWPGAVRNTVDLTRFIALEGRVFVLSAGALLRRSDVPSGFPLRHKLPEREFFHDGGSAIAGPDGCWLVEPVARERRLVVADPDPSPGPPGRQNFDPPGPHSPPRVFPVEVDRTPRPAAHLR